MFKVCYLRVFVIYSMDDNMISPSHRNIEEGVQTSPRKRSSSEN